MTFTDQYGQQLFLDNNWLVINYWATWCKPCRQEVPELNLLQQELTQQSIQVLGVNFDKLEGNALISASKSLDIRFPVLAEDPAARFNLPAGRGLPFTHIVDNNGKLAATLLGEQSRQNILNKLQQLGAL